MLSRSRLAAWKGAERRRVCKRPSHSPNPAAQLQQGFSCSHIGPARSGHRGGCLPSTAGLTGASSSSLCWVVPPQVLLKAFVANLKSGSPTVRRTAAGAAVSVCQHSRRTRYFYSWLLSVLLGGCRLLAVLPAPPLPVGVSRVWGRPGRGSRALGQLAGPWAGPGL